MITVAEVRAEYLPHAGAERLRACSVRLRGGDDGHVELSWASDPGDEARGWTVMAKGEDLLRALDALGLVTPALRGAR